MPSTFPAELYDAVISVHAEDRNFVASCALVCRSWVPTSRHILFGDIRLHNRNVTHFLQLLTSPICTITSFIQVLTFQNPTRFNPLLSSHVQGSHSIIAPSKLRFEEFRGVDVDFNSAQNIFSFDLVSEMEIVNCTFEGYRQLSDTLVLFKDLRRLHMSGIAWFSDSVPADGPNFLPRLDTIEMYNCPFVTAMLRHIQPHPPSYRVLRIVRVTAIDAQDMPCIRDTIQPLSMHLKHLELRSLGADVDAEIGTFKPSNTCMVSRVTP
jgi:hypothetical protein